MTTSIYDNSVLIPLSGSATTDSYADFVVQVLRRYSILSPAGYRTIYTGKTWIDSSGDTVIYLSDILQECRYNVREVYDNATYSYHPASGSMLIEVSENSLYNTTARISFANGEYSDTTINLTAIRQPTPSLSVIDAPSPWSGGVLAYSFAGKPNGVLPRLPAINSNKILFGGLYVSNQALNLCDGTNLLTIVNPREANTQFVATLADIYLTLTNISSATDTLLYISDNSAVKYCDEAIVEVCTKPYYLQWWDFNGIFHSRGMVKNATVGVDNGNADYYTNINTGKSVVENAPRNTWTLNSGNIAKNEYYDLLTLFSAQLVYLYDTDRDMRYKVVVQGSTGQYANRMRNAAKNFTVNIIEA